MRLISIWAALLLSAATLHAVPQEEPAKAEAEWPDRVDVNSAGLLNVHLRNVDIVIALEMLSEQTQRNIVAHEGVSGSVSMVLRNVTFEEALDTLLTARGFAFVERNHVIHVLAKPPEAPAGGAAATAVRVFRLNYISATDADNFVKPLLSADGTTSRLAEAASGIAPSSEEAGGYSPAHGDVLMVIDRPANLERVAEALAEIDVMPQQVLVEATIMRATLNEQNALGIDFNTLAGVDFQVMAASSSGATNVDVGDLPAARFDDTTMATRTGFTDLVPEGGMTFGVIKNNVAAFIRALEQVTDVTIMANPKLLTLNKQRGEVMVGRRDGYLTTTVTETVAVQTVEYLETGTKLVFRPYVTGDGYVRMEIHPEDSNGGLTAANLPFEETTEATTNILLRDGHTILIGGLFRERSTTANSQVPLLGSIPAIGRLFGVAQDQTIREEVVILLTVRIVSNPDEEAAAGAQLYDDVERYRVGARRGLMGIGREQLAEARYQAAVAAYRAGEPDRARWEVGLALHLNPRHIAAIRLKEQLLSERTWHAEGSLMRSFLAERLREEAGLPPRPTFGRPAVEPPATPAAEVTEDEAEPQP